jgi:hypothetical protein
VVKPAVIPSIDLGDLPAYVSSSEEGDHQDHHHNESSAERDYLRNAPNKNSISAADWKE